MKIIKEINLQDFEFWGGAELNIKYITREDLKTLEGIVGDLYPDGITETELNDLIWFEVDNIAKWLGYDDFDNLMEERG